MADSKQKVGVIGSGNIGHCFAVMFAQADYTVCMYDINEQQLELAKKRCLQKLEQLKTEGLLRSEKSVDEIMANISSTTSLTTCVQGAFYIQESVMETLEMKQKIFKQVDKLVDNETTVIASSTSSLQPSLFTNDLEHKAQCIVVHPVFPPIYCPAIEVVPAPWTSDETKGITKQLMIKIGQKPIMLKKEIIGFAVNRLQYGLLAEAYNLVAQDVLSIEDVDAVMSDGLGLRYAFFGVLGTVAMTANGLEDMFTKFAPTAVRICGDLAGPPNLTAQPTMSEMAAEMEKIEHYPSNSGVARSVGMLGKGKKIGIIGCGNIGHCWSLMFAAAGYDVCIFDVSEERLAEAIPKIKQRMEKLQEEGLAKTEEPISSQLSRISTTSELKTCLQGALYVQECVFEDLKLKQKVFAEIDGLLNGSPTVIASSTSTLQPSTFTETLRHRSQMVVAHPVNPPIYVPLVELIPAPWTDPKTTDLAETLMKEIGQRPIRLLKEVVGFAVNRLQYAVIAEAWRMVADGAISMEDVNAVMSQGLGHRYAFFGPLEVAHMNADGIRHHNETYGAGFLRVLNDFGPPPNLMEQPHLDNLSADLNKMIPLDKMSEVRDYREKCLAELAILKKKLEKDRPK